MATLSKKELLLQLLELENGNIGDLGKTESVPPVPQESESKIPLTENAVEVPLTKPKKVLSEKQKEALKRGQDKRNENRELRAAEMKRKKEEEQKILEEKLVKKAIAVKKKQIKRAALLEEISDDEQGTDGSPATPPLPLQKQSAIPVPVVEPPKNRIVFY